MGKKRVVSGQTNERFVIHTLSLGTGLLAGLIIVAYRSSIGWLESARERLTPWIGASAWRLALWVAAAGLAGIAVAFLVRRAPHTKGSGIPQVKAVLMRRIEARWAIELPVKFAGGTLALGAGLSLGREGPSIQLGALTGQAICSLARRQDLGRMLLTAGSAAGISAAFNAPLAGVLFCIEELHRSVSPVMLTAALISSFGANAVMWAFFGSAPVFALPLAGILPLRTLLVAVLVIGSASGLLGAAFNRGLLGFQAAFRKVCPPEPLRLAIAFMAAALVSLQVPLIAGGGERIISGIGSETGSLTALALLFAAKLVFTLFSYASGSPGGIFLPMLSLGALIGAASTHALAALGMGGYLNNYILIGMVGFFTAVVRAPITGAVLITEMAGSFAHFPALILVGVVASIVTALVGNRPVYDVLLGFIPRAPREGREPDEDRPVTLMIPVLEGSAIADCGQARSLMPAACILAAVERGDQELFPDDRLQLHPGDVLRVTVPKGRARSLKEPLLGMGSGERRGLDAD